MSEEAVLLNVLLDSLLPGQDGIKIRAFLAFNRDNPLVKLENINRLKNLGIIDIKGDMLYPLGTL